MTADREGRGLTPIQRRLLEAAMVPRDEAVKDPDFTHTVLTESMQTCGGLVSLR